MSSFSTPAIMLRRTDFGDYDLILTVFTLNRGKLSIIAKSAKKSIKRFSGILELFYVLDIVYSPGRGRRLPVLQEAILKQPFSNIRSNVKKTAYTSYWAELTNEWMEEDERQVHLYRLLCHALEKLDLGQTPEAALSILFQMRFMTISGFSPNLKECSVCRIEMERVKHNRIVFDLGKGSLVCDRCATRLSGKLSLSKGTIKQLQWVQNGALEKAARIRFTPQAMEEGLAFLEAFVPYHLGKEPRSLTFLRQIRG